MNQNNYDITPLPRAIDRKKLKVAMDKKGVEQKDLARLFGLNPCTVSLKMSGKRDFSEQEIYVLVQNFGTQIFLDE